MGAHENWEDDARSVRGGLHLLMDGEPPFGTSTAAAVEDAARRGRRRRAGRMALGGAGVAAMAAAATVAVVALRPQTIESPSFQPAAPPAAVTPTPTAGPNGTAADPMAGAPGYDELVPVVEEIAALTGASSDVRVTPRDDMGEIPGGEEFEPYAADATVTLESGGSLRVSVSVQTVDGGDDVLSVWDESCTLGAGDDKPCEELGRTDVSGAWVFTHPTPAGREALKYAATAPYGGLSVTVDNYTETDGGAKVVGPSWTEAGVTVEAIDQIVAGSGLLDEG